MATTLSSGGQVVIPLGIRKKLGLFEGAVIAYKVVDGKIVLDPNPGGEKASISEVEGRPTLVAPAGVPEMTPELIREILSS